MAGQHAFTGSDAGSVYGSWGESQIDLAAAGVDPGDTIQVQFAVGRDGCGGNDGWYVDDVLIVTCAARRPRRPPRTPRTPRHGSAPRRRRPHHAAAQGGDDDEGEEAGRPAFKATSRSRSSSRRPAPPRPVASSSPTRAKIGKGKLVDGKVKITITKNLKVGKHTLVAKYKGSSTALPSKTKFTIKIVEADDLAPPDSSEGPAGSVRWGPRALCDDVAHATKGRV